eukprot:SAG11_NODE_612_length_8206_cov_4.251110_7_plen_97_part_00
MHAVINDRIGRAVVTWCPTASAVWCGGMGGCVGRWVGQFCAEENLRKFVGRNRVEFVGSTIYEPAETPTASTLPKPRELYFFFSSYLFLFSLLFCI